MTVDWFLFWQQHNARPMITEFELAMGIIQYGTAQMVATMWGFALTANEVAKGFQRMAAYLKDHPVE